MSEAPAPEPDAAEAVPDTGGQGAANPEPDPPDPVTIAPPALEDPPQETSPIGTPTRPPESDEVTTHEEYVDVEEGDLDEEEDSLSGPHDPPKPPPETNGFVGPLINRGPIVSGFEEARKKAADSMRPPPAGGSVSRSVTAINVLIKLHETWGFELKASDNWDEDVVKDCGRLLVDHEWVEDEKRLREAIRALLPRLNPGEFPEDGPWLKLSDDKLRSKFMEQVRKRDVGVAKYLMTSYSTYMGKKRSEQRKTTKTPST
ncbi:MAG: hypothetical protein WA001_01435 [Patescibacteria group bacterium]